MSNELPFDPAGGTRSEEKQSKPNKWTPTQLKIVGRMVQMGCLTLVLLALVVVICFSLGNKENATYTSNLVTVLGAGLGILGGMKLDKGEG